MWRRQIYSYLVICVRAIKKNHNSPTAYEIHHTKYWAKIKRHKGERMNYIYVAMLAGNIIWAPRMSFVYTNNRTSHGLHESNYSYFITTFMVCARAVFRRTSSGNGLRMVGAAEQCGRNDPTICGMRQRSVWSSNSLSVQPHEVATRRFDSFRLLHCAREPQTRAAPYNHTTPLMSIWR